MRGVWGAAGLLVIGFAAAVASGSARSAVLVDPLTTASFAGFDRNVLPVGGRYTAAPSVGTVLSRAAGAGDGGVRDIPVTADTITAAVPEPAACSLPIAGFALTDTTLQWRGRRFSSEPIHA